MIGSLRVCAFHERYSKGITRELLTLLVAEMVRSGHPKSGFPSLYNSCYHALAIERDMTFITADKRHKTKTKVFGHILLLNEWKSN